MTARTASILIAALACAAPALAQDTAPAAPPADASSVILAPKAAPAPAAKPAPHAASSEIDAAISAGVPAYNPGFSATKPIALPQVLLDPDKPKNEIPRLPLEMMSRYVVRETRLPVFRNIDLYTKQGLVDLSFKAHPGLRVGNFFNLNSAAAFEAAMNDQKMSSRQDLVDTAFAMAAGGDPSEAEAVQDSIIDESFRAAMQVGPVGGGPSTH
jgi:hypothetical protein